MNQQVVQSGLVVCIAYSILDRAGNVVEQHDRLWAMSRAAIAAFCPASNPPWRERKSATGMAADSAPPPLH